MARPGEKVILVFNEKPHKMYGIVHLNKHDPKTLNILEGRIVSENQLIAEYNIGIDQPGDYTIGKRHDMTDRIRDVLVVPKGNLPEGDDLMFKELYKRALEEAKDYARERDLKFEDHTDFQPGLLRFL